MFVDCVVGENGGQLEYVVDCVVGENGGQLEYVC